ncbi:larval cuticle protein 65Ag1-like [Amphibalanus amphitrite]|uniref:larval cuticle protein 65Ag1-like n=1 Tax=Amphibalanus amphitrite TaxID=1232801 RepID=UPI001C91500D|nr:larval cuticle protein 65Ag1-like [Amphibalanus amphitrite]
MKYVVALALVAVAAARPQEVVEKTLADFGILRMTSSQSDDGRTFQYAYETADPAAQDVSGELKQIGEEAGTVQRGSYSFTAPDENGNPVDITINWVADEKGFQPQGDAIPVAPVDPNAEAQAAAYASAPQQFE